MDDTARYCVELKTCSKCGEAKELTEFYDRKLKVGVGKVSQCKCCDNERNRKRHKENRHRNNELSKKWRQKNPDKRRKYARKFELKSRYGLSADQYDEILRRQKGGCAVCGITLDSKTRGATPHVDHCHSTGVVRGILCGKHNLAEGLIGTIENARAMVAYMEKNALFYSSTL